VKVGFEVQVTAIPGCYSLYDRCFQMMWLFSGTPEDPEDETVIEMLSTKAVNLAVRSLMYTIHTEDHHTQQDAAHRMIGIGKHWVIRRWSASKHAKGKPAVRIP
jgi:N12 class adenine-specific DNA methylase